jgi:hypothetical protein
VGSTSARRDRRLGAGSRAHTRPAPDGYQAAMVRLPGGRRASIHRMQLTTRSAEAPVTRFVPCLRASAPLVLATSNIHRSARLSSAFRHYLRPRPSGPGALFDRSAERERPTGRSDCTQDGADVPSTRRTRGYLPQPWARTSSVDSRNAGWLRVGSTRMRDGGIIPGTSTTAATGDAHGDAHGVPLHGLLRVRYAACPMA